MTYVTVYDLAEAGYREWYFPVFALLFVVLGGVLFRYRGMFPKTGPDALPRIYPWAVVSLAVLWATVSFIVTFARYHSLRTTLEAGKAEVVEGRITDFAPMPLAGHALEHFSVSGQRFAYSDYIETPGFHNTSSYGGPIRNDLPVRITHTAGIILRLEVAR